MVGNPCVTEVVDCAVINAGQFEVAVYGCPDVADEERSAVFCDEHMVGFGMVWPDG